MKRHLAIIYSHLSHLRKSNAGLTRLVLWLCPFRISISSFPPPSLLTGFSLLRGPLSEFNQWY